MLKDADPNYFAGIYIVCGYTDLRYGIDSLAAIIERKYRGSLFVPNTLFLFCGHAANKIKGLLPASLQARRLRSFHLAQKFFGTSFHVSTAVSLAHARLLD